MQAGCFNVSLPEDALQRIEFIISRTHVYAASYSRIIEIDWPCDIGSPQIKLSANAVVFEIHPAPKTASRTTNLSSRSPRERVWQQGSAVERAFMSRQPRRRSSSFFVLGVKKRRSCPMCEREITSPSYCPVELFASIDPSVVRCTCSPDKSSAPSTLISFIITAPLRQGFLRVGTHAHPFRYPPPPPISIEIHEICL